MIDWQQVWNQWGAIGVVLVFGTMTLIVSARNRAATKDHTDKTASDVNLVLAENIGKLGQAILTGNTQAAAERNQNLDAIRDLTGQMKGMLEITSKTSLSQTAILAHIHGLTDTWERDFPIIKTELGTVREKATALESSLTGALDARFEPVARLLTDLATVVRDWDDRQGVENKHVLQSLDRILLYIKTNLVSEDKPQ